MLHETVVVELFIIRPREADFSSAAGARTIHIGGLYIRSFTSAPFGLPRRSAERERSHEPRASMNVLLRDELTLKLHLFYGFAGVALAASRIFSLVMKRRRVLPSNGRREEADNY
jgi:hypothetical protein